MSVCLLNMENPDNFETYFQTLNMERDTTRTSFRSRLRQYYKVKVRPRLTRKFVAIILFGQFLSMMLCASGVGSQKLVTACGVKIPAFQAFCTYVLLALSFTTQLAYQTKEATRIVKERWWKYIIIAAIDVYANFLVFSAYQYTSLTSVQLLDCLSIPVVVLLSIILLKAKYRPLHFFGVVVCLAGLGLMVWADFTSKNQGPKPGDRHSELLGDLLVISGACFYGASNIAEEYVVKTSTITEFLGMMSFFACFISGANVIIFEWNDLGSMVWNYKTILYLILSVIPMFIFYILMPVLISASSATLVNLTLLTADLYSLFAGLYLFHYTFSHLYILSFVVIILGVIIFKVFPTPSSVDECAERNSQVNDDISSTCSQESIIQPLINSNN